MIHLRADVDRCTLSGMDHVVKFTARLGTASLVVDELSGYMRRVILETPDFSLRVHRILRGDGDRHLHDHPWDFVSLVDPFAWLLQRLGLVPRGRGGYVEAVPIQDSPGALPSASLLSGAWLNREWSPGSVVRHLAEDLHRLSLPRGPVLTLVVTGPRRRPWGFATEHGWIPYREYEAWADGGFSVRAPSHRAREGAPVSGAGEFITTYASAREAPERSTPRRPTFLARLVLRLAGLPGPAVLPGGAP